MDLYHGTSGVGLGCMLLRSQVKAQIAVLDMLDQLVSSRSDMQSEPTFSIPFLIVVYWNTRLFSNIS